MASTITGGAESDDAENDTLPCLDVLFDPPIYHVCESGDTTFTIRSDTRPTIRIRVSSCILAAFSKVFKTLLHGQFREGGKEEIVLDEPPRPMKMLCSILHMQPLDDTPDGFEMLELAMLVDKYDCTVPLRSAISCLLDDVAVNEAGSLNPGQLVAAAYIADQPAHFRKFTRELVLCSTLRRDQLDQRCLELLPPNLLASLCAQQASAQNELTLRLTTLIAELCDAGEGTDLVGTSLALFKAHGVWPIDHGRMSISDTLAALDCIDMGVTAGHHYEQRVRTTDAQVSRDIELAAREVKVAAKEVKVAAKEARLAATSSQRDSSSCGDPAWGSKRWYKTLKSPQISSGPIFRSPDYFSKVPSRGEMEQLIKKRDVVASTQNHGKIGKYFARAESGVEGHGVVLVFVI